MTDLSIRPASPADADIIADFNVRMAMETEGKVLRQETVGAGVAAALADASKARYFVACVGGWIVGQVMVTWEWSDWRNGWIWWLQSVYVDPEFRRQGVFRNLCEHVAECARLEAAVGVRLYVEESNHAAQRTYQRLGFGTAGYLVYELEL